jgi:hypothetical protein
MAEKKLQVCKRRLGRVGLLAGKERLQKELVDMEGDPEYIWRGDFGKPPLKSTKKRKKCRLGDGQYWFRSVHMVLVPACCIRE